MTEHEKKRDAKSLISSILGSMSKPKPTADDEPVHAAAIAEPEVEAAPVVLDHDQEAAELIEVYFELDTATERDLLFERVVALRSPVVNEFLLGMMEEDDDDYLRMAAAAELAKRGFAQAVVVMEEQLAAPDDFDFFVQAVDALSHVRGRAFYDELLAIWRDAERDDEERRHAMEALEDINEERALADYLAYASTFGETLSRLDDESLSEDQLQVALSAFARHRRLEASPVLETLQQSIRRNPSLDEDEKVLLVNLIEDARDFLSQPT